MADLIRTTAHGPAVNQIELHPWFPNKELVDFCHQHGIVLTAYGSMGSSRMASQITAQQILQQIGQKYGKTAGQVLLRWAVQNNVTVIPGTGNPKHMQENLELFDFALDPGEMHFLDTGIPEDQRMHLYGHSPETIL